MADDRLEQSRLKAKAKDVEKKEVEVKVIAHSMQRFAVWFGGSMLASMPQFYEMSHTKAEYAEQGPRIARHNAVLKAL
jgi:actin-related protein 3